jgi:phosphocarrier protein
MKTTAQSASVTISNARGLHARASAKFSTMAQSFAARVTVHGENMSVDGASILDLLLLGAGPGTALRIEAEGDDAAAAVAALSRLVADQFGEQD